MASAAAGGYSLAAQSRRQPAVVSTSGRSVSSLPALAWARCRRTRCHIRRLHRNLTATRGERCAEVVGDADGGAGDNNQEGANGTGSRALSDSSIELLKDACGVDYLDAEPPPLSELIQVMRLESLNEADLSAAFRTMDRDEDGLVSYDEVASLVQERLDPAGGASVQTIAMALMTQFDKDREGRISFDSFSSTVRDLAERIDKRIWPLAVCQGVAGLVVGMISPVLPLLVTDMGLSMEDYGVTSSIMGLAKMMVNVPATMGLDVFGRLPLMTGGLLLLCVSYIGMAGVTSFLQLLAARISTGCGVSIWGISSTAYAIDISHPLNRARCMAPLFTAFSAGATIGPILGGYVLGSLGMKATFLIAGALFGTLAISSQLIIPETHKKRADRNTGRASPRLLLRSWARVTADSGVRGAAILNGANNFAQIATTWTLLPLLLVNQFQVSPAGLGTIYATISFFDMLTAQPVAAFADKIGHKNIMVPSALAMAVGMALLAASNSLVNAAPGLALWAIGHAMIGSSPTAYTCSVTSAKQRSQGVAVMRITGDIGTMLGGLTAGMVAHHYSVTSALGCTAAVMAVAMGSFVLLTFRGVGPHQQDALPSAAGA